MQTPVQFTENAIKEIARLSSQNNETRALRVGVKGGGCSGMSYLLEYSDKEDNDMEFEMNGLQFIMNKAHEIYLSGMLIDFEGGLNSRGFIFKNPNASSTCGCGSSFAV
ncbi:MAG: iron-sulfur cluster assembly accessory protein [Chitinophagaceae bacterium]|nr:MAG: iron-sulfur cluster assembly accessory protein [Bacteroidetes bacterium OLB11]MCC6447410.1 iron-sulfur cluster assembly accessory protein [Chitinophagaceae bacterium]HMN32573.1 iron-sulfur cluster assembly accessory protein [Chitinophagaceae bacterium]